jgi:hypothetical protein
MLLLGIALIAARFGEAYTPNAQPSGEEERVILRSTSFRDLPFRTSSVTSGAAREVAGIRNGSVRVKSKVRAEEVFILQIRVKIDRNRRWCSISIECIMKVQRKVCIFPLRDLKGIFNVHQYK